MSLQSAIGVAASGLSNITQGLAVISNNVANASTPNYAVEVATQSSLTAGGQGFGALTGPVIREIDLQLQAEMFRQNATVSGLQTRQSALQPIDATQGTPGSGSDLSSKLGALSDAFTTLQSDPSSAASQAQVVTAAGNLASQINTLSRSYATARQNAQDNAGSDITKLNAAITTVADLDSKIITAQQAGQSTADLENQRDISLNTMSSLASFTFIRQPNGGLMAATAGGLSISLQNPAPQFSMASSVANQQTYYPGGGIQGIMLNGADVTAQITGGTIGANIQLRDQLLPQYQGELDEFANTLQSRFSAQGLQLFTTPQPISTTLVPPPAQAGYVGYSATIAVNPAVVANPAAVRDGTTAIAGSGTGASAFTPNPAGGPAGFGTLISRVLNYSFGTDVQANVKQPVPSLSGLGPAGILSAPFAAPTDLAGFSTSLVASQSADVGDTSTHLTTETSVQSALSKQFTSSSGVNTDAELSKMVALQNAYGANSRIIAAAQAMWNQLISSVP